MSRIPINPFDLTEVEKEELDAMSKQLQGLRLLGSCAFVLRSTGKRVVFTPCDAECLRCDVWVEPDMNFNDRMGRSS